MGGAGYKAEIYAGGLGYRHVPEPKMGTGGVGYQLNQKISIQKTANRTINGKLT